MRDASREDRSTKRRRTAEPANPKTIFPRKNGTPLCPNNDLDPNPPGFSPSHPRETYLLTDPLPPVRTEPASL